MFQGHENGAVLHVCAKSLLLLCCLLAPGGAPSFQHRALRISQLIESQTHKKHAHTQFKCIIMLTSNINEEALDTETQRLIPNGKLDSQESKKTKLNEGRGMNSRRREFTSQS